MDKIKEYIIVTGMSPQKLIEEVNLKITWNYQPFGGVAVLSLHPHEGVVYSQAMVKY